MRDLGYLAEITERWNPHAQVRQDLFGFGDVLALRRDEVLIVQATSRPNIASRVNKIADHPNIAAVRAAGVRVEVWGWGMLASGKVECKVVDCS